jgi:hypothetical protein
MKKTFIPILFILFSGVLYAQPKFDLGLKAGINNSKISFDIDDYNSESITKAHFGAFGRLGWGKIFVQPEIYYSSKGGNFDVNSGALDAVKSIDYSSVDVPVLLGFDLFKVSIVDVHILGGPLFSFVTSSSVSGDTDFSTKYIEDHYMGFQYGLGIDVWFLTFDARMEHGGKNLFSVPDVEGNNRTFMLTVGLKIL